MKRILTFTTSFFSFISIVSAQYANTNHSIQNQESLPPGGYQIWTFDNDGGISGITAIPEIQCASSISPSIEITNFGSNPLTSATIEYDLDGNALAPYYWSGNLAGNQSEAIMLPDITAAPGLHILNVAVTVANGTIDANNGNNNNIEFTIIGTPLPAPISEGFENGFLPEGFFVINPSNDETWNMYAGGGGYGESQSCMQLWMYNTNGGEIDEFFIRNVDLSFSSDPVLVFDMAYALYNFWYQDKLKIWVSTDCGGSWSLVFNEDGEAMQTTSPTTAEFYPSYKTWNTKTVALLPYVGNSNVQIKFQGISDDGNNLYIDNISIGENTGIHSPTPLGNSLTLIPNPADEYSKLEIKNFSGGKFFYEIYNSVGQRITDQIPMFLPVISISTSSFDNGFYTICAHSAEGQIFQSSLLVQH